MPRSQSPLRVATDADVAPKAKTVVEAAAGEQPRELLVALRTRIAQTVQDPTTPPRDLASLTRRLMEIAKEIESIDAEDEDAESSSIPDEKFDAKAL